MNKILRMAFVAAMVLMSVNTFAQNDDVTFTLTKMIELGWTKDQSLDGVNYTQKNIEISFSKGEGESNPIYTDFTRNGSTSTVVKLNVGNKLTLTSNSKTFTKIVLSPTVGSQAPKGSNYEMEFTEGSYTETGYTWTGRTSYFSLKNISNTAGIQIQKITISWEDGVTSGIEEIYTNNSKNDGKVYDISGKYIGKDAKSISKSGVYVINGKKTMIKK